MTDNHIATATCTNLEVSSNSGQHSVCCLASSWLIGTQSGQFGQFGNEKWAVWEWEGEDHSGTITHHNLSPFPSQDPLPNFPWTNAIKETGVGSKTPIGHQVSYGKVSLNFFYLSSPRLFDLLLIHSVQQELHHQFICFGLAEGRTGL